MKTQMQPQQTETTNKPGFFAAMPGSEAQREVVRRMQAGETLMWFGNNGPEISGRPFWPQKRTVRAMLKSGVLKWGKHHNETQRECGICPLLLNVGGQRPSTGNEASDE